MAAVRTPTGRRRHRPDCRLLAGKATLPDATEAYPWCVHCYRRSSCVCCDEALDDATPNPACHPMCDECAETMVASQVQTSRRPLECRWCKADDHGGGRPCGTVDASRLSPALRQRLQAEDTSDRRTTTPWDEATLTRCPSCAVPYDSFDGCLALRCTACQANFCALCHEVATGSEAAHEHVRSACACNDEAPELYWATAKYERFAEDRRVAQLQAWVRCAPPLDALRACLALTTLYPRTWVALSLWRLQWLFLVAWTRTVYERLGHALTQTRACLQFLLGA